MICVVDASVAVEYLLRTPLGRSLAPQLEAADLMAPELLDAEVLWVIRKLMLRGTITEERAAQAVEDLSAWPVLRVAHPGLLLRAWAWRHKVSAYDALYLAVCELFGALLLTADGPLARVPVSGVVIQNARG